MPVADTTAEAKALTHAQLCLSRAKIHVLESHPFYGHILMRMRFELKPHLTMCDGTEVISATDGKTVYIHPELYAALPKDQQVSTLIHEQLHVLDGHLWRVGKRDARYANIAQDIYIYHTLAREGFAALVENQATLEYFGGDLDQFKGEFWEMIYDRLSPPQPQPQSGNGSGKGAKSQPQGLQCYHPQPKDSESSANVEQWIREAGAYAKSVGARPGAWSKLVEAVTPAVPLETHLHEFLKRGLGGDQSFDSFNRRHLWRGDYFPSEVVEQMGETIVTIDTSGSRCEDELAHALGVICDWREHHPCRLHVVQCDYAVTDWTTYEEHEPLPPRRELKGHGGTSFAPPFTKAMAMHLEPAALIYITDGCGYEFAEKPAYPVLWVLTGECHREFKPPYGDVIYLDDGRQR